MAGMVCPNCGEQTFFKTPKGRKCTRCGCEMVVPVLGGKGGKGQLCPNCRRHTMFDGKCTNCGAELSCPE